MYGLYVRPSSREPQIIVWLCVTSVWKSIITANPAASERPCVPPEVSLLLRNLLADCTWARHRQFSSALCKPLPSWLQVTKTQTLRRPTHASRVVVLPLGISHTCGKPNYLARLRSFCSAAVPEDSNLVDPASSHMLVSKTKPCMSKYKCYTMKLRMAH